MLTFQVSPIVNSAASIVMLRNVTSPGRSSASASDGFGSSSAGGAGSVGDRRRRVVGTGRQVAGPSLRALIGGRAAAPGRATMRRPAARRAPAQSAPARRDGPSPVGASPLGVLHSRACVLHDTAPTDSIVASIACARSSLEAHPHDGGSRQAQTTTTPIPSVTVSPPVDAGCNCTRCGCDSVRSCSSRASRSWIAGIGPSTASVTLRRSSANGVALSLPASVGASVSGSSPLLQGRCVGCADFDLPNLAAAFAHDVDQPAAKLREPRRRRPRDCSSASSSPLDRGGPLLVLGQRSGGLLVHEPILRTVRYDCLRLSKYSSTSGSHGRQRDQSRRGRNDWPTVTAFAEFAD